MVSEREKQKIANDLSRSIVESVARFMEDASQTMDRASVGQIATHAAISASVGTYMTWCKAVGVDFNPDFLRLALDLALSQRFQFAERRPDGSFGAPQSVM